MADFPERIEVDSVLGRQLRGLAETLAPAGYPWEWDRTVELSYIDERDGNAWATVTIRIDRSSEKLWKRGGGEGGQDV